MRFLWFFFLGIPLFSYEWICGSSFKEGCNHVLEGSHRIDPLSVRENDLIFVKGSQIHYFFSFIHPQIQSPYILITHNCPIEIPSRFAPFLDDSKLIAWFGTNVTVTHPKLFPIPLGVQNPNPHANHDLHLEKWRQISQTSSRNILLYLNFSDETFPERALIRTFFKEKPFCTLAPRKSFDRYLEDLSHSRFVLSPRGLGIDCFRTWESILLGAIPIVKTSPLDPLFEDLPVLIVTDWEMITEEFLLEKEREIRSRPICWEKLSPAYWIKGRLGDL